MPDKGKFDLGDYVEVKDRIKLFYELYAQGRLVTTSVATEMGPDGTPRVIVAAAAYRTPDDPQPARGWSWMALPGTTTYTRGSELENTETSAWGRAIAALGILVDRSIASANEIAGKADERPARPAPAHLPPRAEPSSLIGIVEVGDKTSSDFELRYDPEGIGHVGFRLKGDKGGILVEAAGALAEDLMVSRADLVGKRVSCWGRIEPRSFESGTPRRTINYQALALERLTGPDGLAFPVVREAPTAPMFDEEAEIDAALAKV